MALGREIKLSDSNLTPELVAERVAVSNISGTSMVVNVFGDVVSQHGGWIWLGSLIRALAPLGYSERLVRTAVYRLIQQNWLQVSKVGRRSYYGFTDMAKRHYEQAARRIYSAGHPDWDGYWTLVAPVTVPEDRRDDFRRSLLWQGFNPLATGVYAHPSAERTSLDETLYDLDLVGHVVVFTARTEDLHSQTALRELVQDKWQLSELEEMYGEFLEFYRPLSRQLSGRTLDPELCFLLRAVVTHDYRRILLRDPEIPQAMLPEGWPGLEAYELMKHLYRLLAAPSVDYIRGTLESAEGALPSPSASFYERFGGLGLKRRAP